MLSFATWKDFYLFVVKPIFDKFNLMRELYTEFRGKEVMEMILADGSQL